jgi:MFS-type transporter involved in bile tolerance (Atg22 family)
MGYGKAIWGWAIYDWANSAFATTVMAGFFPIFFSRETQQICRSLIQMMDNSVQMGKKCFV